MGFQIPDSLAEPWSSEGLVSKEYLWNSAEQKLITCTDSSPISFPAWSLDQQDLAMGTFPFAHPTEGSRGLPAKPREAQAGASVSLHGNISPWVSGVHLSLQRQQQPFQCSHGYFTPSLDKAISKPIACVKFWPHPTAGKWSHSRHLLFNSCPTTKRDIFYFLFIFSLFPSDSLSPCSSFLPHSMEVSSAAIIWQLIS